MEGATHSSSLLAKTIRIMTVLIRTNFTGKDILPLHERPVSIKPLARREMNEFAEGMKKIRY